MTESTVVHDTFVVTRRYDAPVANVFRAWSDPKRKATWFAGSVDALGDTYELDFRVGGLEVFRSGPPGGPLYTYTVDYRDIVARARIVSTSSMSADSTLLSVTATTVEFRPAGPMTCLVLTEQATFLDGYETPSQREEGTRALLDSLANFLS